MECACRVSWAALNGGKPDLPVCAAGTEQQEPRKQEEGSSVDIEIVLQRGHGLTCSTNTGTHTGTNTQTRTCLVRTSGLL